MKKIGILGWYAHNNVGDESYKHSFPILFPDNSFTFTDFLSKDIKEKNEIFILGGGGVLDESFIKQTNEIENKYIISANATEKTPFSLLKNFKKIIVRDIKSYNILKKNEIKCDFMPDIAFLLSPNPKNGIEYLNKKFKKDKHDLYEKKIVIVYNSHLNVITKDRHLSRDELTFLKTANDLSEIIDNTPASFVFIPFGQSQPWDDRISNSWLSSKCKYWKKNIIIYDEINFQQVLDIISCCNLTISTRLHASIFSCLSETPFIDITHHDKNLGFLETIGKQDWSVSYWRFEYDKINNLVKEFLSNSSKHKEELNKIVKIQKNKIREVISNVHFL